MQKKRNKKTSAGQRRSSTGAPLTILEKALLGGGVIRTSANAAAKAQARAAHEKKYSK